MPGMWYLLGMTGVTILVKCSDSTVRILGLILKKNGVKWRPSSLKNLPGLMTRNNNIDGSLAAMESRKQKENKSRTFLQWGIVPLRTNCHLFSRCAKPHLRERPGWRRCLQSEFLKMSFCNWHRNWPSSDLPSPFLLWFSSAGLVLSLTPFPIFLLCA